MPRLHLFTIKVEALPLFAADRTEASSELIARAIDEHPSFTDSWDRQWHLGDLREVPPNGRHFRLVLVRKDEATDFDEDASVTVETKQRHVDYSEVVLDLDSQVAGISFERALSYRVTTIATRLGDLLQQSSAIDSDLYRVRVAAIPDPKGFIAKVRDAHRVTAVTFWFGLPNFPQTPNVKKGLQIFTAEAKGDGGRATVHGEDLDRGTVADIASESAKTSEDVSVRIERTDDTRTGETIHLKDGATTKTVDVDDIATAQAREEALERLSRTYEDLEDVG